MAKRSEMSWCSKNLLSKIFLVSVLLQISLGFDIFEEEKATPRMRRQGLIPLARLGRGRLLTTIDDKEAGGSLIAYPRLGRRVFELHQTLIPYPRAGRLIEDPESLDYDILLNADYGPSLLDDTLTDAFLNNQLGVQKRGTVKLIPRIGRKKRSVSEEHEDQSNRESDQALPSTGGNRRFWNDLDGIDQDYFFKSDKKGMRSKNALVPRIGKKSFDEIEDFESKRAAAFTPRIGRASLIPRIGRNDPRFRLKSRGAFIPRIGRRAALIPRIGRSENQQVENEQSD